MCKVADLVDQKNGHRADIKAVYRKCLRRPRLSYDEFRYIFRLDLPDEQDYFFIAKKARNSVKTIQEIKMFQPTQKVIKKLNKRNKF